MSNKDIGTCPCPLCKREGTVRKFENGKRKGQLYVRCPVHTHIAVPGRDFQVWVLDNAKMYGPDQDIPPSPPHVEAPDPEEEEIVAAPEPETKPAEKVTQVRDRVGFFPLFGD